MKGKSRQRNWLHYLFRSRVVSKIIGMSKKSLYRLKSRILLFISWIKVKSLIIIEHIYITAMLDGRRNFTLTSKNRDQEDIKASADYQCPSLVRPARPIVTKQGFWLKKFHVNALNTTIQHVDITYNCGITNRNSVRGFRKSWNIIEIKLHLVKKASDTSNVTIIPSDTWNNILATRHIKNRVNLIFKISKKYLSENNIMTITRLWGGSIKSIRQLG